MTPKKPVRIVTPTQFRKAVEAAKPVKKPCNCGKKNNK